MNKINPLPPEVVEGLSICFKTAKILKDAFPNDIMKINDNTILPHQAKDRKIRHKGGMGGNYAYYQIKTPHRVIIKQKTLIERIVFITNLTTHKDRWELYGNFALIELMCHELAHHRTKGHAKGFKIKYRRLWAFMVNQVISGEFYG